jgi:hypothetical protein
MRRFGKVRALQSIEDKPPMPEPDPPPPWEELPYITEHINNAYEDNTLHPAYIDQCPTQTLQELPQTASSTMITDGNGYPTENTEHPTIIPSNQGTIPLQNKQCAYSSKETCTSISPQPQYEST